MNRLRALLIAILVIGISGVLVSLLDAGATESVRAISRSLIPLAAGVVIGAVGVFLGSLGNLYGVFATRERMDGVDLSGTVTAVRATVKEIKHDVLFVLCVAIVVEAIFALRPLDLPFVRWPLEVEWFTRSIVLDTIVLGLTVLAYLAVIDTVRAMFEIHSQYDALHRSSTEIG